MGVHLPPPQWTNTQAQGAEAARAVLTGRRGVSTTDSSTGPVPAGAAGRQELGTLPDGEAQSCPQDLAWWGGHPGGPHVHGETAGGPGPRTTRERGLCPSEEADTSFHSKSDREAQPCGHCLVQETPGRAALPRATQRR